MASFIGQSPSLVHLNLAGMNLGESLILLKKEGIDQSKSLLCVHLSDNHFGKDAQFEYQQMTGLNRAVARAVHTNKSLSEIEELAETEVQNG
jgi:hypothetical protein